MYAEDLPSHNGSDWELLQLVGVKSKVAYADRGLTQLNVSTKVFHTFTLHLLLHSS